jgi:transposase
MKRQSYTAEFRQEAVKLILIDGTSVKEVSEQLGVPQGVLYSWKQKHLDQMEADAPEGAQSPKALAKENEQLRKELAKQRRMNEILKKTVGYFSNPE